jgi:hypothetical protein
MVRVKGFLAAGLSVLAISLGAITGCQTDSASTKPATSMPAAKPAAAAPAAALPKPAAAPAAAAPAATPARPAAAAQPDARKIIRVKAGVTDPVKDSKGNTWEADTNYVDGGTPYDRPTIDVSNTTEKALFLAERYGDSDFTYTFKVPNGKYKVNLYFAETYEGISGAGERVFDYEVQGNRVKNFDIYKKTGAAMKADVETQDAEVKDGKLVIKFYNTGTQNPCINAIEIIPA